MTSQITTTNAPSLPRRFIRLRTLGAIELRVDGGDELHSVLRQPKRVALLTYLALAPSRGFRRRDTLVGLFWPELDDEHARGALRQGVHFLRRHLGSDAIVSRGEEDLGLSNGVWCDATDFERAISEQRPGDALALYGGDFLPGFHVSDAAPDLDEWIERERGRLRDLAARAAWDLARKAEGSGSVTEATRWAHRGMALSTQDEATLRRLMSLLDRVGDRAGALRAYEEFSRRLVEEFATTPSAETKALLEAVRTRQREAAARLLGGAQRSPMPPRPAPAEVVTDQAVIPAPLPKPRPPARRLTTAAAIAAAAVLVAMGAIAIAREAPGSATVLAVGAIRDHTGDGGSSSSAALGDLLSTNLARVPGIQMVSTARLYEVLAQTERLTDTPAMMARAARIAGATEVLEGALYRGPEGTLRLDLRRVGVEDGAVRGAYPVTGPHLFAVVDSVTLALARDFDVNAPRLRVSDVSTTSLVAHRFYEEGLRAFNQGDARAAQRLFEAAVAEDSTFAMALYYVAVCRLTLWDEPSAVKHLRTATRLAGRTTERERLLIQTSLAFHTGDPWGAALAETLATRYPTDPDGHLLLGRARKASGAFLEALPHLRRVIYMDSMAFRGGTVRCRACEAVGEIANALWHADSLLAAERLIRGMADRWGGPGWTKELGMMLERQGRLDEALATFQRTGASWPSDEWEHRVRLAIRGAEFDEADRILGDVIRNRPDVRPHAHWLSAISLRYQGRLSEALSIARRLRQMSPAHEGSSISQGAVIEALVLFELGRTQQAAALFDSLGRLPPLDMPGRAARNRTWMLTHAAASRATGGDTTHLVALADSIEADGRRSGYGRDPRLHHHARGLLWRARGRPVEAEDAFRRAIYSRTLGYTRTNLELGRLLIQQRRPHEAVDILAPALRGPLDASNLYVTHTELRELLARAYDATGQRDSAVANYRWVVRAWRTADRAFHARRDSARRRLTELEWRILGARPGR